MPGTATGARSLPSPPARHHQPRTSQHCVRGLHARSQKLGLEGLHGGVEPKLLGPPSPVVCTRRTAANDRFSPFAALRSVSVRGQVPIPCSPRLHRPPPHRSWATGRPRSADSAAQRPSVPGAWHIRLPSETPFQAISGPYHRHTLRPTSMGPRGARSWSPSENLTTHATGAAGPGTRRLAPVGPFRVETLTRCLTGQGCAIGRGAEPSLWESIHAARPHAGDAHRTRPLIQPSASDRPASDAARMRGALGQRDRVNRRAGPLPRSES